MMLIDGIDDYGFYIDIYTLFCFLTGFFLLLVEFVFREMLIMWLLFLEDVEAIYVKLYFENGKLVPNYLSWYL